MRIMRSGISKYRPCLAVPLLAASLFSSVLAAAPLSQQGRSCHLPGHDEPLRCFDVPVPLDYQRPEGERLMLHVAVASAFRESAQPDPLFVLAGGPGQAGSDILPLLDTTFPKVRATRDIVFIDQRGTGLSGKLDCASLQAVEDLPEAEQGAAIEACMRSLNRPFRVYNTENSVRDLERIRESLGYRQVNLWGASYGTRLGQAYARSFPERTRALILDGVAAPEQIIFAWGSDVQTALETMFKHCAAERGCRAAFPALPEQFKRLRQRGDGGVALDLPHPRTAGRIRMQMTPARFVETVRVALYSAGASRSLPFLIDSADQGNWRPFLAQMFSTSDFAVTGSALGLTLAVTCAEDIPRLTPAILADEQSNSFLAASLIKQVPQWCRSVDVPPVPFREPSQIRAPALLLSGALDPVTPPRRAASAARNMAHAQHFIVDNAGHVVSPLGCAPRLLREFLDRPQRPLDAQCLREIPQVSFQLGAAGPQP